MEISIKIFLWLVGSPIVFLAIAGVAFLINERVCNWKSKKGTIQ